MEGKIPKVNLTIKAYISIRVKDESSELINQAFSLVSEEVFVHFDCEYSKYLVTALPKAYYAKPRFH
jgi:hypothetical protein